MKIKNLNKLSKTELKYWERYAKNEINEWWRFLIEVKKIRK